MTQCWRDASRRLDVVQAYDSLQQLIRVRVDTVEAVSDFDQKWNQLKQNQERAPGNDTDLGSRIALAGSFATDDSSSPPDKPSLLDSDGGVYESIRSDDLIIDVGDADEMHAPVYQSPATVLANSVKATEIPVQAIIHRRISDSSEDQIFVENEFTNTSVLQSHMAPIQSVDQTAGTYERHISPILPEAKMKDINIVKNDLSLEVKEHFSNVLTSEAQEEDNANASCSNFESRLLTDDEDFSDFVRTSPTAPSLDFTDFASADISAHDVHVDRDQQFKNETSSDVPGSDIETRKYTDMPVGAAAKNISLDHDLDAFSDFVTSDPPHKFGTMEILTENLDTAPFQDKNPGLTEKKDNPSLLGDDKGTSDSDSDTFSDFVSSVPTQESNHAQDAKLASTSMSNSGNQDIASVSVLSSQDRSLDISFPKPVPESQTQMENLSTAPPNTDIDLQMQGSLKDFGYDSETGSAAVDFDVKKTSGEKITADHNQNIFSSELFPSDLSSLSSDMSMLIHDSLATSIENVPVYSKQPEHDADIGQLSETSVQLPETDIQIPETDVQFPETDIQFPETDVYQLPETDIQFPETDVQFPETDVHQLPETDVHQLSETNVQIPETDVHQLPEKDIQFPETDVHQFPETDIQLPETDVQLPETNVHQLPETDVHQLPETDVHQLPETDVHQLPETDVHQLPETDVHLHETNVQFLKTDVQFPETNVHVPETNVRIPETDVQFPETDVQFPEANVQIPKTDVHFFETDAHQLHETNVQFSETDVHKLLETNVQFSETDGHKLPETNVQFSETDVHKLPETDVQFFETDIQSSETDVHKLPETNLQSSETDVHKLPETSVDFFETDVHQLPETDVHQLPETDVHQLPETDVHQLPETDVHFSETDVHFSETGAHNLPERTNVEQPLYSPERGDDTDALEHGKPLLPLATGETNNSLESFDFFTEFTSVANMSTDSADVGGEKDGQTKQESGNLDVQPGMSFGLLDSQLGQGSGSIMSVVEILGKETSPGATQVEALDAQFGFDLTPPAVGPQAQQDDLMPPAVGPQTQQDDLMPPAVGPQAQQDDLMPPAVGPQAQQDDQITDLHKSNGDVNATSAEQVEQPLINF